MGRCSWTWLATLADGGAGSVVVHRFCVEELRVPVTTSWSWNLMLQLVESKVATHPASQSCPRERREVLPSVGKVWTVVASFGIVSMGRLAVWVEYMYSWLAVLTAN